MPSARRREKRIGLLTGGGDCPGLNQALRGCFYKASELGYGCVGIRNGWKGMLERDSFDMKLADVEGLAGAGGTMLGTSRTNPYKKDGGGAAAVESFKAMGLDALVAMGGDDTLGVAARLYKEENLPVLGVPKTMDNDLSGTDSTFGFDTASSVAAEAAERLKDTGKSHGRIMILEVMGRHAGWVALHTGLAAGADCVLLPERPFDLKRTRDILKSAHARKGYALLVASEALELAAEKNEKLDEFGHMTLKKRGVGERLAEILEAETGIEVRSTAIGHIQRGGPPTLFDRILASRVGIKAAELVHEGTFGVMAALKGGRVVAVPLQEAVGRLKTVSKEFLDVMDVLCPLLPASAAPRHVA